MSELLPCPFCGSTDIQLWSGFGTQAEIECSECCCGRYVQVADLFESDERPAFNDDTCRYPDDAVARVNAHLIEEWNRRALSPPDAAVTIREPTEAEVNSVCLSYRHDFGLLTGSHRSLVQFTAREWLIAWRKEGFGCDRDEVIEECARIIDQCNREGPYQAIAAAPRIRALKHAVSSTATRE